MPMLEGNDQSAEELAKNPEFVKILSVLKTCPVAGCVLINGDGDIRTQQPAEDVLYFTAVAPTIGIPHNANRRKELLVRDLFGFCDLFHRLRMLRSKVMSRSNSRIHQRGPTLTNQNTPCSFSHFL